ncbi:YpsA SLOG family protein [Raphidiopsis sp. BLCC-F218]
MPVGEVCSLNVAGPRASAEPEIYEFVMKVLDDSFPC